MCGLPGGAPAQDGAHDTQEGSKDLSDWDKTVCLGLSRNEYSAMRSMMLRLIRP